MINDPIFQACMNVILFVAILLILTNLIESLIFFFAKKKKEASTTRITASFIGLISGTVGGMHSWGEFLHRDLKLTGLMFEADTGRSLINVPSSDWTGWIALTIFPDFLITGILSAIMSCTIIGWSLFFIRRKNGGLILILLSVMAILFGCGFIPPFMGIIAGAIGTRIKHTDHKIEKIKIG